MSGKHESIPRVLWRHGIRLFVGIVFIYAGYIKIIDPMGFAKNIYQYQILSDYWVNVTAIILPWLEVVCGLSLVFIPRLRRGSSAWIFLMLLVFTVAVAYSVLRGLDISCGCLSTDPEAAKIGWKKVTENIGMIVLTALIFIQAGKHPSVAEE